MSRREKKDWRQESICPFGWGGVGTVLFCTLSEEGYLEAYGPEVETSMA
jgi:hypothetical protein